METILYYSNYCNNCKQLLQNVSKNVEFKNSTHFICIDNRIRKDKDIYVILPNQKELLMPEFIKCVPSLQLLNRGNKCLTGSQILEYIDSKQEKKIIEEPQCFNFNDINNSGVFSDCYSFLDQTIESMSAKGNGGLRQLRNNATLEYMDNIETPIDDYTPNKVGEISMDHIQQEREKSLKN
tara:strand:- start:2289 stop:2831 length:543 start_codon:yes stop_codon:yes gene_type:complete